MNFWLSFGETSHPALWLKRALLGCALVFLASSASAMRERAYYELIIKSLPFGDMADTQMNDSADDIVATPEEIQEESNKIQLCAMTITPDGRTAVGLIDNGTNPPAYITLFDGDEANGLELLVSDLDEEFATFRRSGITFTLGLGLGLLETITPELLAQRKLEAEEAEIAEEEKKRKKPNSLAEQLIAMQMSFPPDMEAPPLPIPIGSPEEFTKKFDPEKVESDPQTDQEALIQAGVAELKEAIATGESPQEYLQRLVAHRQEEVKRQQQEKAAAREALEAEIATGTLSEDAEAMLRRQTNIELMKKGVVPLSPVEDLTEEEQAEINAALEKML